MEQIEYPVMSGGDTIAVVTVLLETGMLPMQEPVTELVLEAPAGLIKVSAHCRDGKVKGVTFRNVPANAAHLDAVIEVPHLGSIKVDVGWGGMFYVIADVRQFDGLEITPSHGSEFARVSSMIREAAIEQLPVTHPDCPGVGITISQLSGPTMAPHGDWKKHRYYVCRGVLLGQSSDLDRRDRPLSLRNGHLRRDGCSPCQGPVGVT